MKLSTIINKGVEFAETGECTMKHVAMIVRKGQILWHAVNEYASVGTIHAEERVLQSTPFKFRKKRQYVQGRSICTSI